MDALAKSLQGRFLVIDGPDGAGKSTQLNLLRDRLTLIGAAVEVVIDPGGTAVGGEIRNILLHAKDLHVAPMCETLLFMASRAQLVEEKIRPALTAGKVVLSDRFISATLAYQGALGVDAKMILDLGGKAVGGTWPDLTILLDLPAEIGLDRIQRGRDRMESRALAYHQEVQRRFAGLGSEKHPYPRPVVHLSAAGRPEEVHASVVKALEETFEIT
ncbi:MAG: dTMP kinase [Phycisphaerae bacterium]|nr:dTMP kinase [Phycisphaerae bacterium]